MQADVVERAAVLAGLEIPRRPFAQNQRMLREECERADLTDGTGRDEFADGEVAAMIAQIQQAADDFAFFTPASDSIRSSSVKSVQIGLSDSTCLPAERAAMINSPRREK